MVNNLSNSIFGALGQAALTGQGIYQTNPAMLQNAYGQGQANATIAAMQRQYNQALAQPRWMIDGQRFANSDEFARHLFPDDEQARLMFKLKYPE